MKNLLYVIVGIIFVAVVGMVAYLIYNIKRGDDDPENEPIIHNYKLSQCPFRHGKVKDMKIGEERIKFVISPRLDINYIKAKNNPEYEEHLKEYTVYFDKRQVETQAGDSSPNIPIIKAYPNNINLLPEGFKQTSEGKFIMEKIIKNNKMTDESELMQERMNNLRKISSQTFGGEIFIDFASKSREVLKEMKDVSQKEEKKFGENK